MSEQRLYSILDRCLIAVDRVVRTLSEQPLHAGCTYPPEDDAAQLHDVVLSPEQVQHVAGIMRINHAGEVAAQALYHGHLLSAVSPELQKNLAQAALEEGDHLLWCWRRLQELTSHPSYLKPLWYGGGLFLGIAAGWWGDASIVSFIAETESQVMQHLTAQLALLPTQDVRSRAILQQMLLDETQHCNAACRAGASPLPVILPLVMRIMAKFMVYTAYWV